MHWQSCFAAVSNPVGKFCGFWEEGVERDGKEKLRVWNMRERELALRLLCLHQLQAARAVQIVEEFGAGPRLPSPALR